MLYVKGTKVTAAHAEEFKEKMPGLAIFFH
jgi:hypothetical protein